MSNCTPTMNENGTSSVRCLTGQPECGMLPGTRLVEGRDYAGAASLNRSRTWIPGGATNCRTREGSTLRRF
jgi:hypothetical protein